MPPVRAVKNQYRGVNAHLHSLFQNQEGWEEFHTGHITDIARVLQVELRARGYVATVERSLQIRHADDSKWKPQSDIIISDTDPSRTAAPAAAAVADAQEIALPIAELLHLRDDEMTFKAVTIVRADVPGEPVAWLELLSPSNKPMGQDYPKYIAKRQLVIEQGIVFVEIDYLHQTPSTFDVFPSYRPTRRDPHPDPNARPYQITIIDPRPDLRDGLGRTRLFAVDDPLPTMTIPLSGDDKISFDFGMPYRKTFEEMFYGDRIDYTALPLRFDTYQEIDGAKILSRMLHVMERAARGETLETDPQPIDVLPYDDALARWQALTGA